MRPLLSVELPLELEDYRSQIESTVKPYIKIVAQPENNMIPWQSKFGGAPYLPQGSQYPRDSKGQPLFLLAQINFNELPRLEPFPRHGILQFYIADDDLYGLQFEDMTKQENFRICYFPEVFENAERLVTDFSFLPSSTFIPISISKQCSLMFELSQQPISAGDYQFEAKIFDGNFPGPRENLYEILGKYEKLCGADGHKIGGYPYFTQYDPRAGGKYLSQDFILLLQIDTDRDADIMWGDCGVGNFFIRELDLKNCDFSNVMYNWDCS
jgi:uncharacterized protein YwqG